MARIWTLFGLYLVEKGGHEMKLVFWTKEYNYHWNYIYKYLSPLVDGKITVIVQNELSDYRKQVGWSNQTDDEFETTFITKKNWYGRAPGIIRENRDAIHFFLGFTGKWCTLYIFPLILYSLLLNIKTIVMVEHFSKSPAGYYSDEPSILSWIKVRLRPTLYRVSAGIMKYFAKKDTLYFLAQSPLAKQVMVEAGVAPHSVFCFGYFVPKYTTEIMPVNRAHNPMKAIYVGSLIKRKGVDLVVEVLSQVNAKETRIQFDIFGPGSPDPSLQTNIPGVTFKGVIQQDQVQQTIAQYDLLILPSRHDGWGVVVNEALLQGVPVLVSDEAGSSCLVKNSQAGMLFKSGDLDDLKSKLLLLLDNTKLLPTLRSNAKKVSFMIVPDIAARYLFNVLGFYFELDRSSTFPKAIWSEDQ